MRSRPQRSLPAARVASSLDALTSMDGHVTTHSRTGGSGSMGFDRHLGIKSPSHGTSFENGCDRSAGTTTQRQRLWTGLFGAAPANRFRRPWTSLCTSLQQTSRELRSFDEYTLPYGVKVPNFSSGSSGRRDRRYEDDGAPGVTRTRDPRFRKTYRYAGPIEFKRLTGAGKRRYAQIWTHFCTLGAPCGIGSVVECRKGARLEGALESGNPEPLPSACHREARREVPRERGRVY